MEIWYLQVTTCFLKILNDVIDCCLEQLPLQCFDFVSVFFLFANNNTTNSKFYSEANKLQQQKRLPCAGSMRAIRGEEKTANW